MKQDFVIGLFEQCGMAVLASQQISNQYWPDCDAYQEIRHANPWWLIRTEAGVVMIGRRKRVWSVDWELTDMRGRLTNDQGVTVGETYVHAWSLEKLVEYLKALGSHVRNIVQSRAALAKAGAT